MKYGIGFEGIRHDRSSLGLIVAFPMIGVTLSCASARLDPNRNQALTFDTTTPGDAGATPLAQSTPVKATASQPSNVEKANTQSSDAGTSAEPITCTVDPPDPKPLHTRDWVVYEFLFKKGRLGFSLNRASKPPNRATRRVSLVATQLNCGSVANSLIAFDLASRYRRPNNRAHPAPDILCTNNRR